MDLISRKDAFAQGKKHFYTGRPCRRGHLRERSVKTGACLGCLAHYAREYNARFSGAVEHTVQVDKSHIPAIDAFVALLNLAKMRGVEGPLIPTLEQVSSVNTMIRMMQPAAPAAPVAATPARAPAPLPTPPQAAPATPVDDPRHAVWVRIHGRDIADQMIASGM